MFIDSVNCLLLSGTLQRVVMRYREDGMALCTGKLHLEEAGQGDKKSNVYHTFVPFEAYGKTAEALGVRQVEDLVLLTGKLVLRKASDRQGQSDLTVLVTKHALLLPAAAAA